ncbi:hypothetical protein DFH08DRAFT_907100 [Mycena albidolilacea]|uniref:Uncharacterized protein n=1 Tax=Mycena albidolilacea TaxID=1033008 RepID=A0AAD7E7X5_9AGAR|nr:hypothetical protein DFH08DRAFT_907100 [Mycena albidolilacea]
MSSTTKSRMSVLFRWTVAALLRQRSPAKRHPIRDHSRPNCAILHKSILITSCDNDPSPSSSSKSYKVPTAKVQLILIDVLPTQSWTSRAVIECDKVSHAVHCPPPFARG